MRRRPAMHRTLLAVLLAAVLAGCAAPGNTVPDDGADQPFVWPDMDAAILRPGGKISGCTLAFVFTDTAGREVYVSTAAHCLPGIPVGSAIDLAGVPGTLVYSAWETMGLTQPAPPLTYETTCAHEPAPDVCSGNDFALIRIDDAHRDKVHPAMLHFGGPTGMADTRHVAAGDPLVTYGNSGGRPVDEVKPREGVAAMRMNDWTTSAYFVGGGIPGDSGSAVSRANGEAFGLLVTLDAVPPGSTGITHLDVAVAYMLQHEGIEVKLATWDLR